MNCALHGESFHSDSIKTTRIGLSVAVDQVRACRTDFRRFFGSYSGDARHELFHR